MKLFLSGSTSFLGGKFIETFGGDYDIFGFSKSDKINQIDFLDRDKLKTSFKKFSPDAVVHFAASVDYDAEKSKATNIQGTGNLLSLAKIKDLPFIFMSSESVYGGRWETGDYHEDEKFQPRSKYAESKTESDLLVQNSGLPFLILRGHKFVGFVKNYKKPKQFPDTIKSILNGEEVRLDNKKLFRPTLINHVCEAVDHYLQNDLGKQLIFNIGAERETTYFDFVRDVIKKLGLNTDLIKSGGDESGWPQNSTLNLDKLNSSNYSKLSYKRLLDTLEQDFKKISI